MMRLSLSLSGRLSVCLLHRHQVNTSHARTIIRYFVDSCNCSLSLSLIGSVSHASPSSLVSTRTRFVDVFQLVIDMYRSLTFRNRCCRRERSSTNASVTLSIVRHRSIDANQDEQTNSTDTFDSIDFQARSVVYL
jgi:hypothetical protein